MYLFAKKLVVESKTSSICACAQMSSPKLDCQEDDGSGASNEARGACAPLTPEVSGRGAEDGDVGGRIAAGLERDMPDNGLLGTSNSALHTSHQEVSSH